MGFDSGFKGLTYHPTNYYYYYRRIEIIGIESIIRYNIVRKYRVAVLWTAGFNSLLYQDFSVLITSSEYLWDLLSFYEKGKVKI